MVSDRTIKKVTFGAGKAAGVGLLPYLIFSLIMAVLPYGCESEAADRHSVADGAKQHRRNKVAANTVSPKAASCL
jgi:hypothetical protein